MSRILLVDDYPDALEVWALYLRMCGFEVATALDGATALAMATERPPDIAILDLEMPGMSGYDVARALRAGVGTADVPIIAVTGHSHPARIEEALAAGCDRVLTKPCDPDALCDEVRERLGLEGGPTGVAAVAVNRHHASHQG